MVACFGERWTCAISCFYLCCFSLPSSHSLGAERERDSHFMNKRAFLIHREGKVLLFSLRFFFSVCFRFVHVILFEIRHVRMPTTHKSTKSLTAKNLRNSLRYQKFLVTRRHIFFFRAIFFFFVCPNLHLIHAFRTSDNKSYFRKIFRFSEDEYIFCSQMYIIRVNQIA